MLRAFLFMVISAANTAHHFANTTGKDCHDDR